MDADEPALVPQWLKGGASSGSAFGNHISGAASRDTNSSAKRNNPDWDDKPNDDRYKPARHAEPLASKSGEDLALWKPAQTFNSSNSNLNGRSTAVRLYPEDRDRAPDYDSRAARGRTTGYLTRGRGDARNGFDARNSFQEPNDSHDKRKPSDAPATHVPITKGAFEKNFPTLAEQKPPAYTPAVAPYKQNYLTSKGSGNWTSKLADSPSANSSPLPNDNNSNATTPSLPTSPTTQAPTPKMSETLQQTLSNGTNSADRQRLDKLAAKQSRQLIPVIASSNKPRTVSKFTPVGKPIARGPEPRKVLEAPAPSPFARKPVATNTMDRGGSITRTGSAPLPASQSTSSAQAAAQPTGMVSLKPVGSGKPSERTSFFESLRRKTSLPDAVTGEQLSAQIAADSNSAVAHEASVQRDPADAVSLAKEGEVPREDKGANGTGAGVEASPAAAVATAAGQAAAVETVPTVEMPVAHGYGEQHQQHQQHRQMRGKASTKLQDLGEAEEVAFLRLLGWEEPEDGDDEGLTEEEIAAFKAAAEARPPPRAQSLQTSTSSLRQAVHSMISSSYGSNNSFADTDSD